MCLYSFRRRIAITLSDMGMKPPCLDDGNKTANLLFKLKKISI